ncbi:MAG: hypothetical protein GY861_22895 [bacterium]|nr:hypothetical protein [bacterium]
MAYKINELMYVEWQDCGWHGTSIVHKLTKTRVYGSDKKVGECRLKDCGISSWYKVFNFLDKNKKLIPWWEFEVMYPGLPEYWRK